MPSPSPLPWLPPSPALSPAVLASADFQSSLFWALLIGWIMTVVLHEFAHGLVASWGGDYTIRQRGGLTLNPLQYVDPMMSLVLPAIFLLMGGVPLPGGATYIRRDLLRNNFWHSAVSAAGPAMNLLIFLGLCVLIHPALGWVDYHLPVRKWPNAQLFAAGMAFLQLLSVLLNLLPIPPLDGFGIIEPALPPATRRKLMDPQIRLACFVGFFLLIQWPPVWDLFHHIIIHAFRLMGINGYRANTALQVCLFGRHDTL